MTINCCKGCPDRTLGCHGKCEAYQSQRKALDEFNAKVQSAKEQERSFVIRRVVKK